MFTHQNSNRILTPEDLKKFNETVVEFSVSNDRSHPYSPIYDLVCEQFFGAEDKGKEPNLANKVLYLLKSDGPEKQKAIEDFQKNWKRFIKDLEYYLQSYTTTLAFAKNKELSYEVSTKTRTDLYFDLYNKVLSLQDDVHKIKHLSIDRNLSGFTGTLKWLGSIYTHLKCQTEKDCEAILGDLTKLQEVLDYCSRKEVEQLGNFTPKVDKL